MQTEVYEPTARSTVNRYKARAVYDHAVVHSIVDSSPVLHVSFNPTSLAEDPFPTTLPMIGCTGAFTSPSAEGTSPIPATCIYLHGHASSRLMKLPSVGPNDLNAIDEFIGLPGTPVCIAATQMDGLVLALTAFNHSCNYRSAVVHGYANIVDDPVEKIYALTQITNNLLPKRWENTRVPPTDAEMNATTVLRVDIVSASAKVRAGAPGNERADLDEGNERVMEMRRRVWTGVIPSWRIWGEPIPAEENIVKDVPGYISDWVATENGKGEDYSNEIARKKYGTKKE